LGEGQDIFARKYMHEKLTKCPNFTQLLPEKYFHDFFGRGGTCPLPPVSYAYMSLQVTYLAVGRDEQTAFNANVGVVGLVAADTVRQAVV